MNSVANSPQEIQSMNLWLEQVAHGLYEAERAAHPDRQMPTWDRAHRGLREDARYRAIGAHMRHDSTVKAVLVERIAMALALADGIIWPACESPIRPRFISDEQYAAIIAERRQFYRHKARLVITTTFNYLDVNAAAEPLEHRIATIARTKAQQLKDVITMQTWRAIRCVTNGVRVSVPISVEGDVLGDSRR